MLRCHIMGKLMVMRRFQKSTLACVQNSNRTRNFTRFYPRLSFDSHKLGKSNLQRSLKQPLFWMLRAYKCYPSAFHTLWPFYRPHHQRTVINVFFYVISVYAPVSISIVMITLISATMPCNKEILGVITQMWRRRCRMRQPSLEIHLVLLYSLFTG